ncbi:uncharacterized protein MAM_00398 [Metarhizium album ARSEF 1941]|uniref:DUF7029 domain-containing protein n=1 Tax=Metarhizium album (strain ARSEF 1941) TaxID=1081103 RepID=A0A0B2WYP7_METAS|nr:uncharacterized protein MAM_00398 [Metarhizium album ARSEF 1941]KHO01397.1 hypothetical protein MAM_00398 [Metarhizium album ARSEF 1941]
MLPVACAVAVFLGAAHPAVAQRARFSLGNSTANATESQVDPNVVWTTVTEIVTQTAGAECSAAKDALHAQPTPAESPTATFVNRASATTLSPTVHWSYDTRDVKNVVPVEPDKGCELYYGVSDPSESGSYAFVQTFFKSPAVNIDHSDYVAVEYREQQGMTVTFDNQEAFKNALDTWTTSSGLLLIAYTPGCGEYAKGERCYFNVTDIEYKPEKLVIAAKGDPVHPDQVAHLYEAEWGWWDASKEKAQTSASSASASASSAPKTPLGQLDCTAPSDDAHGLPTACLGSNFDRILDEKLGYAKLSPEARQFLDSLSSGSNTTLSALAQRMRRRSLAQRGFWSKAWDFVKDASKTVYHAVASAINIGGEIDGDISFHVPDPESSNTGAKALLSGLTQAESPWGEAILLKSLGSPGAARGGSDRKYINVYCVGCGASGHAKVTGRAKWSPLSGLEEGRLELQANLQVILKLGIEAEMSLRQNYDYDLFSYGLPGLSFGVVTIGPYVSVGARVVLEAAARGQVLVGAEMGFQDSLVVIDLVNPNENRNTGWEPYFKPVFEASGEVEVSAEFGLPVGLKCGLKISSFEKAVGVVDEPSIKGLAKAAVSANLTDTGNIVAGLGDSEGCRGIVTQLSWRNRLWAGLVEADDAPLLDTKDRALFRGCIGSSNDNKPARRALVDGTRPMRIARDRRHVQATNKTTQPGSGSKSPKYNVESVPTKLYNNSPSYHGLSPLVDPSGSTRIVSCANGNIYAVRNDNQDNGYCSGLWNTTVQAQVVQDAVHRSLHYYSETMSTLGVSRLRAGGAAEVPRTAVTVALVPFPNPDGDDFYVVADDAENVFFPVVCDFVDKTASKVFVVKDATTGLDMLRRRDLMHSVTGGEVSKCYPLALKS